MTKLLQIKDAVSIHRFPVSFVSLYNYVWWQDGMFQRAVLKLTSQQH